MILRLFCLFLTLSATYSVDRNCLDYKDDNGLAPLRLRHANSEQWGISFQTYPLLLKKLFSQELHTEKAVFGIHSPKWMICAIPYISVNRETVQVSLLKDSLEHWKTIGTIDLKQQDMSTIEAVTFAESFLSRFIAEERSLFSYYAPNNPKEIAYSADWTEIDECLYLNLFSYFTPSRAQQSAFKEEINELITLMIGEFFKKRYYISQFIQDLHQSKKLTIRDESNIQTLFYGYLVNILRIKDKEAVQLADFFNTKIYYMALILQDPTENEGALFNELLNRFQGDGYIQANQRRLYKDYFEG